MSLSGLQKYILKTCYGQKKLLVKARFEKYYSGVNKVPVKSEQIKIISRSIDRLINKGYLVGYGEKTQYKWFIYEVKLTSVGRRTSKKLQGEQIKLPFKNK